MMLVHRQNFYERLTGEKHVIQILFQKHRCYKVEVDGEFYSTAETKLEAFDEIVDIIKANRWSGICLV